MSDSFKWPCPTCGNVGFDDGGDGFFYCRRCFFQSDDMFNTGDADENFVDKGGDPGNAIYSTRHRRHSHAAAAIIKAEPLSQSQSLYQSQLFKTLTLNDDDIPIKQEFREEDGEFMLDGVGPTGPSDFGSEDMGGSRGPSFEDYYSEVRMRYVMGIQLMIQLQCQALVDKFGASPLVCGFSGSIWLQFVAVSGVFDDEWADDAIHESETQNPGEPKDFKPRNSAEPHTLHGDRAIMVWYRSLRKKIPLSSSLVVSFLACHIAREAILPTDILKWSLEGKLPYFSAFVEIEKYVGRPSSACPLSSSFMFRPSQAISLQILESMAASVARSISLNLPPVNFYAIASRYLKHLSLPVEKILPHACRIYEWSMPPDLWLSANEFRLPTRVCVMSILIVAIRYLYNIHGFGEWEKSLSSSRGSSMSSHQIGKLKARCNSKLEDDAKQDCGSSSCNLDGLGTKPVRNSAHPVKSELNAADLLYNLEAKYNEISVTYEFSKDLPTYLQFCKNEVFAELETSLEHYEEEKIVENLWDFYQNQKDSEPLEDHGIACDSVLKQKRARADDGLIDSVLKENKKSKDKMCSCSPSVDNESFHADDYPQQSPDDECSSPSPGKGQNAEPNQQTSVETLKDKAIRRIKSDMEENRFCYIPPRVNLKRFDYLHYARKKDKGALFYVAHADYYILLRSCARTAQVDVRIMHVGVLSLERRLAWLEKGIDHCLNLSPPNVSHE